MPLIPWMFLCGLILFGSQVRGRGRGSLKYIDSETRETQLVLEIVDCVR